MFNAVLVLIFIVTLICVAKHEKKKKSKAILDSYAGKEIQCTCEACSKVWHYGQREIVQSMQSRKRRKARMMMAAGGDRRAWAINVEEPYAYFDKCPSCGSLRITKKTISLK